MEKNSLTNNEILQAVFEAATDAIIIINGRGIIMDTNPAASRLFMYSKEQLIGSNVNMLMPSPHQENHDDYLIRHLETGRTRIIGIGREVEAVRGDGTRFPIELTVSRVDAADVVLFAGIIRDITDRKEFMRDLEERENELRAIITTAVDAIIVIDRHGLIRLFNPAAEQTFGYTVHEVLGRNVKMLMPASFANEHDQYLQAYHRTGKARIIGKGREVFGQRKTQETFPLHLSVSEARMGRAVHYVAILRDLSEQKELERSVVNQEEKERRRIGQDLHDVLAQDLTALTLLCKALGDQFSGEKAPPELGTIHELARKALDESRRLAAGLFPTGLEAAGLVNTLQDWCNSENRSADPVLRFQASEAAEARLSLETELHLYRICQEAVRNAISHASARNITVRLIRLPGHIELSVDDDGKGFDLDEPHKRMGLSTMRHRASLLGAEWSLETSESGTSLVCLVPLNQQSRST